jgi:signal peptidase II
MRLLYRIIILFIILSAGYIIDHATKAAAKEKLSDGQAYSYFFDTFRIQYSENTGAFLSLGEKLTGEAGFIILTFLPAVFLVLLFFYVLFSKKMPVSQVVAFTLIFTGGASNIVDRFTAGRHVIDFMNLGIGPYLRTGIFNFADLYIMAGFFILIILMFMENKDKKKAPVEETKPE